MGCLDRDKLPCHLAIIMDGNGRWAQQKHLSRIKGHQKGLESLRVVVETCAELGIKILTLYAFSKENWQRPPQEINFLMNLLSEFIDKELDEIRENNIRLNVIGCLDDLPKPLQKKTRKSLEETKSNTGMVLTLALSYSSRSEIVETVKSIAREAQEKTIDPEKITENFISSRLYTNDLPDPDLLIRTSGEFRISNFLLWQVSYTEFHVISKLWPEFDKADLLEAIEVFNKRERRFGKTGSAN